MVPHNEPIIYGGPFVATTPKQMEEMKRRYSQGKMGELKAYYRPCFAYNIQGFANVHAAVPADLCKNKD